SAGSGPRESWPTPTRAARARVSSARTRFSSVSVAASRPTSPSNRRSQQGHGRPVRAVVAPRPAAGQDVFTMPDEPSPRPLLDKLGVKQGHRVAVIGLDDPAFVDLLRTRS